MTDSLNIIVGAGFSYSAGLPLGNDVKNKFDMSFKDRLLKASSSEWFWTEGKDEAFISNGRAGSDWLEYPFILEEIVNDYKKGQDGFIDYEDFYQYLKDNTRVEGWYDKIIEIAKQRFYKETSVKEDSEYYGFAFRNPERYRPGEIINYLIADLLTIKKSDKELIEAYDPFIKHIQKYKSVYIFSLNHDMLFERLFKIYGLTYCDGFTSTGSIFKYQNKFLPNFQNEFSSARIKLIKLHGSIDMYLFEHGDENGATLTRTGEYSYFKPGGYHEKHYAVRIDPETKQQVQKMNFDIIPKFITGKNKKAFIESDYMYSEMYKLYKEQIPSGNDLLIVGYSFRDVHMDEILKTFTKTTGPNLVNLNHGDLFPYSAPQVSEIKNISELLRK
jgi:hypothetical protein